MSALLEITHDLVFLKVFESSPHREVLVSTETVRVLGKNNHEDGDWSHDGDSETTTQSIFVLVARVGLSPLLRVRPPSPSGWVRPWGLSPPSETFRDRSDRPYDGWARAGPTAPRAPRVVRARLDVAAAGTTAAAQRPRERRHRGAAATPPSNGVDGRLLECPPPCSTPPGCGGGLGSSLRRPRSGFWTPSGPRRATTTPSVAVAFKFGDPHDDPPALPVTPAPPKRHWDAQASAIAVAWVVD